MKAFNNKLEVGQLAMIINTRLPENKHLIGRVVTVEWISREPVRMPEEFLCADPMRVVCSRNSAIVSGHSTPHSRKFFREGIASYDLDYLMPLPPLEEKELAKEKEKEYA